MIKSRLNSVLKFINYWFFRYLMVTELYMTEPWERVAIQKERKRTKKEKIAFC
ncbi:hypothetical protein ACKWTF_003273 [Chironomus riparius]